MDCSTGHAGSRSGSSEISVCCSDGPNVKALCHQGAETQPGGGLMMGWDGMCRQQRTEQEPGKGDPQSLLAQIFWLFLLCLCLPSCPFLPCFTLTLSQDFLGLASRIIVTLGDHASFFLGLLRVTFCTKQGITDPFVSSLPRFYQHCGEQSLGNSFDFSCVYRAE